MNSTSGCAALARAHFTVPVGRLISRKAVLLTLVLAQSTATLLSAQTRSAAAVASPALTLEQALARATRTSEQVEVARAGVLRANGQQYQARSALWPQVSSSITWQKTLQNQFEALTRRANNGGTGDNGDDSSSTANNPLTTIFASPYQTTVAISAQQSLYSGGRTRAIIRAAAAGRDAADIGLSSAEAQVQLDVTVAYFDALLSDRLVAIAESSLLQTERTLRQVQLTKQVGSASEFELLRARVTRDNQRPQYLQARTARDMAYLHLKQLLDVPLDEPLSLRDDLSDVPAASTAPTPTSLNVTREEVIVADPRVRRAVDEVLATSDTGLRMRAPVRQATAAVEAATQQLRASRAQRGPAIALSTSYQRLAYPSSGFARSLGDYYPNWTVGVGISFPFFTGGRVRGELMAAEAGVIDAQQRLQQAQEGATLDARQAVAQLEEAQEAWLASIGTAEQATRAYGIAEVRYREGISTQLELSESRVQLQQAEANRARAARDLQVARTRLRLLRNLPLAGAAGFSTPSGGTTP